MGSGASVKRAPAGAALPSELPSLKIALVGDPGVGKTSILLRYLRNQFSPMYIPTKKVVIENVVRKYNVPANTVVSLTFWDIPGREDMDLHKAYFRNLDAAIVIVDMTNPVTLDMANVWKQTVLNKLTRTVAPDNKTAPSGGQELQEVPVDPVNFPVLLLGNKFDIIEQEIYEELARKQVSVSMDVTKEMELSHASVTHLKDIADNHGFIGNVMVSAKQTDNSVAMAIQSLVRNILEKKNIPRKWKPVPEKTPVPKEKPYVYDKLEKIDEEKSDELITKADLLVKETKVLRHYYIVALARFKDICVKGHIVMDTRASFEDCISGVIKGVKEGSSVKIVEDEDFYKLELTWDEEKDKVRQHKMWKKAFKCFHNEYATVAKAILKEGPAVDNALEKYDVAMGLIVDNHPAPELTNKKAALKKQQEVQVMTNKIVRNRAKIQHAISEMKETIQEVEKAGRKISNVDHW